MAVSANYFIKWRDGRRRNKSNLEDSTSPSTHSEKGDKREGLRDKTKKKGGKKWGAWFWPELFSISLLVEQLVDVSLNTDCLLGRVHRTQMNGSSLLSVPADGDISDGGAFRFQSASAYSVPTPQVVIGLCDICFLVPRERNKTRIDSRSVVLPLPFPENASSPPRLHAWLTFNHQRECCSSWVLSLALPLRDDDPTRLALPPDIGFPGHKTEAKAIEVTLPSVFLSKQSGKECWYGRDSSSSPSLLCLSSNQTLIK